MLSMVPPYLHRNIKTSSRLAESPALSRIADFSIPTGCPASYSSVAWREEADGFGSSSRIWFHTNPKRKL